MVEGRVLHEPCSFELGPHIRIRGPMLVAGESRAVLDEQSYDSGIVGAWCADEISAKVESDAQGLGFVLEMIEVGTLGEITRRPVARH
jgi:hypothetical protein